MEDKHSLLIEIKNGNEEILEAMDSIIEAMFNKANKKNLRRVNMYLNPRSEFIKAGFLGIMIIYSILVSVYILIDPISVPVFLATFACLWTAVSVANHALEDFDRFLFLCNRYRQLKSLLLMSFTIDQIRNQYIADHPNQEVDDIQ